MKKAIFLSIILILVMFLAACGSSAPVPTPTPKPTQTPTIKPIPTFSLPDYNVSFGNTPVYKDGMESDGKIHVYLVGSGETVKAKKSSSIKSMTYYADSDHLIINFNGKEYAFANVSSSLWKSFKEASSSEAYYDSHIKGNKTYWINDYNGKNGDKIVMEHVSSASQSYSSLNNSYSNSSSDWSSSEYDVYDEYAACEDCGEIYSKDEMWNMGGYYICQNCAEDGDYIYDEGSGELYYEDDYWDMMHEQEFGY